MIVIIQERELQIKSLPVFSVIMFGLSAASFLIMRSYESQIAGWSAVAFGFACIITMIISGLQKINKGKVAKSQP